MNSKKAGMRAIILLSYTFTMMLTSVAMPIMGNIVQAFPQGGSKVMMVMSIWSLTIIPAMLLASYLSKIVSKKWIIIVGTILYCIGGISCAFSNSLDFIVFMRGVSGFGVGLIFPMIPALIAQVYKGDEIGKMIGWGYAVGSIFSGAASAVAGYLAVTNWHNAFFITFIYVLVLIGQIFWLPAVPPEKQDKVMAETKAKASLNWLAWVYIIICGIWMILAMVYIMQTSVFLMQEKIGNSVQAGLASTAVSYTAMVFSFIFGWVLKGLKRYTFVGGILATGLTFFLLSIAHSFPLVLAASICMGICLGMVLPYLIAGMSKILPKGAVTTAISFTSTSMYIGQFLAAYFITFLISASGGSTRAAFSTMSIILGVMVVLSVVFIIATKKKYNDLVASYSQESAAK